MRKRTGEGMRKVRAESYDAVTARNIVHMITDADGGITVHRKQGGAVMQKGVKDEFFKGFRCRMGMDCYLCLPDGKRC